MFSNRWVILWDNEPVGLDSNSGGYPFKTSIPEQVKYWKSKNEAQKYLDIMTMKGTSQTYISNYKIVEIQFRIMG
jgi:hypothetical protein